MAATYVVEKLREMFPRRAGTFTFTLSDSVAFMAYVRQVMEDDRSKARFPLLNLFCNWTLHTEIEGSAEGYQLLTDVTVVLLETADQVERERRISDLLSSAALRHEIVGLLKEQGIDTDIFESDAGWTMFGRQFFKAVAEKRIKFPPLPEQTKAARFYAAVKDRAGDRLGEAALSIRLTLLSPEVPKTVRWVIETVGGTDVNGRYLNREPKTAFPIESNWDGPIAQIRIRGT
jgi:hypothetical protein